MGTRSQLHLILKRIPGVKDAYYVSPGVEKMVYPSIRYSRDDTSKRYANNNPYMVEYAYQLIVITTDPDSPIFEAVEMLPKCVFQREYRKEQLVHQVFKIYF